VLLQRDVCFCKETRKFYKKLLDRQQIPRNTLRITPRNKFVYHFSSKRILTAPPCPSPSTLANTIAGPIWTETRLVDLDLLLHKKTTNSNIVCPLSDVMAVIIFFKKNYLKIYQIIFFKIIGKNYLCQRRVHDPIKRWMRRDLDIFMDQCKNFD